MGLTAELARKQVAPAHRGSGKVRTLAPDLHARRTSQLLAAHVVLAVSWTTWRLLESSPGIASAWGGTFAGSIAGRSLALVTLLAAVLAFFVVLVRTAQGWRDPRATGLLVALLAAVPARAGIDVFDLVYVGLVAMLATAWFDGRWRRRRSLAAKEHT